MAPGSNSVTVRLDGARGTGSTTVPITPPLRPVVYRCSSRSAGCYWRSAFLVVGIVSIAGAAVRESVLSPGAAPDKRRVWRARIAMLASLVFCVLVIGGGKHWWDGVDAAFQNSLYRPFAISLSRTTDGGRARMRLKIIDSAWVMRNDSAWLRRTHNPAWSPLITDHGKLMHLFLVKMPRNGCVRAPASRHERFRHVHVRSSGASGRSLFRIRRYRARKRVYKEGRSWETFGSL